ncbi:MAG: molybdopterin-dependent oxidoreductase [Pseudomonadales bacterium]
MTELEGRITPTELYYVVAQMNMPDPIHPDDWAMEICGEVDSPVSLTLEDIKKLPSQTVRAVTECAGNDALFFDYLHKGGRKPSLLPPGQSNIGNFRNKDEQINAQSIPTNGMSSAGEFTGVPLREVLQMAGVKDGAVAIRMVGFDVGRPDPSLVYMSAGTKDIDVKDPGTINYDKGLPIEKALDHDTLLAWAMNGEHLRHVHGAPLRLIVPGWSGNWWVKWIEKIEVMDHMPDCYHQTEYFVLGESHDDPNKVMCSALGVKTLILDPLDEDSPLPPGSHIVRGLAWSGEGAVTQVEISTDGGNNWQDAHIETSHDRWMWVRWSYVWNVDDPGTYQIMARATDEKGRVQPQIPWNYQRKHFDGIVPTDVVIE